jgi:hypothetical protein
MSGNVEFLVNPQYSKMRRGAYQITLTHSQDWTRLWPREDGVSPLFRLATLPVRLLALALLWATSAPGRLLFATAAGTAATVALIAR